MVSFIEMHGFYYAVLWIRDRFGIDLVSRTQITDLLDPDLDPDPAFYVSG
jgi:hypothetical protein